MSKELNKARDSMTLIKCDKSVLRKGKFGFVESDAKSLLNEAERLLHIHHTGLWEKDDLDTNKRYRKLLDDYRRADRQVTSEHSSSGISQDDIIDKLDAVKAIINKITEERNM